MRAFWLATKGAVARYRCLRDRGRPSKAVRHEPATASVDDFSQRGGMSIWLAAYCFAIVSGLRTIWKERPHRPSVAPNSVQTFTLDNSQSDSLRCHFQSIGTEQGPGHRPERPALVPRPDSYQSPAAIAVSLELSNLSDRQRWQRCWPQGTGRAVRLDA